MDVLALRGQKQPAMEQQAEVNACKAHDAKQEVQHDVMPQPQKGESIANIVVIYKIEEMLPLQ